MAQQRRRKPSLVKHPSNGSTPQEKLETLVQERIEEMVKGLSPQQASELIPEVNKRVAALLESNGAPAATGSAELLSGSSLNTSGLGAGMDALSRATELPFPEFTAKLVTSTFDAVVGATIHQMEAYADLVANIAKTIQDFETSNISDAEITKFLADNYPDGSGGTSVRDTYTFIPNPPDSAAQVLGKVFHDLVDVQLAGIWTGGPTTTGDFPQPSAPVTTTPPGPATSFTSAQVDAIRKAVKRLLATGQLEQLKLMAREGLARIKVKDGSVLSKLTFHVSTTDEQAASASQYTQNQVGAYIRGGIKRRWGSVSGGVSYSGLSVKTVNERTFNKVTMDAELVGKVKIHFQTETFPPVQ